MIATFDTPWNKIRFTAADWILGQVKPFYNRNALTRLPTRMAFEAALQEEQQVVMFIDLDNLKQINDLQGYRAGDAAIQATAEAILRYVRQEDLVSHWGGDEFAVLLDQVGLFAAQRVAQRILGYLNSLGYAACIGLGATMQAAQEAQQVAKRNGKNGICY